MPNTICYESINSMAMWYCTIYFLGLWKLERNILIVIRTFYILHLYAYYNVCAVFGGHTVYLWLTDDLLYIYYISDR